MAELLLTINTSLHRYAAPYQPEYDLRLFVGAADQSRRDTRGRLLLSVELGTLLDPRDTPVKRRRRALVVPLRRRSVALLFEDVGAMYEPGQAMVAPLPSLLAGRLARPWVLGVMMQEDQPILVLDPRQIAQHVLQQSVALQQGDPV